MKTVAATISIALAAAACVSAAASGPPRLTLTVETGGATGAVMVSLFDSETAYASGPPVRRARIDVAAGERSTVFADLPAGTYAIKAFHDVDGDGRLNTNPFGIPIEPVAFSNNAPATMGPAAWESARLTVKGATVQTIRFGK